jgi:hypothetical protein
MGTGPAMMIWEDRANRKNAETFMAEFRERGTLTILYTMA